MSSIIDGLNAPNTAPPSANVSGGALDQRAFLRLLTTQMTVQDPFNPVDNTQMVAQMAQFSSVAGIAEMNQSLKTLVGALGNRMGDASSWIGRSMLTESQVATPLRDGSYAGELTLPDAAENVSVSFVDANGATVHTLDLGARDAGATAFAWDGKDAAGQTVADRPLRVVVTARTAAGAALEPTIATWTPIGGVQSPAAGAAARLVTGLGLLAPEAALRIA